MDEVNQGADAKSSAEKQDSRFLEFNLGDKNYAFPLLQVKEVIPIPDTTEIPRSPQFFIGIMNLRGQVISIIDLRKKMGIKPLGDDAEEAVIIVSLGEVQVGMIVDSINRVLNINSSEMSEVPEVQAQINAKFIQGVFKQETGLTILLDLAKIIDIDEIESFKRELRTA